MNTKTQILASLSSGMLAGTTSTNAAESGNLETSVTGLESDQGKVRIALFNVEAAYAESSEDEGAFRGVEVDIRGGEARRTFKDIPFGDYAIKLYHDKPY